MKTRMHRRVIRAWICMAFIAGTLIIGAGTAHAVDPGIVTGAVTSPDPNSGLGVAACPGDGAPTQSCQGFQFTLVDPGDGNYSLALAPGTWSVVGFGFFPSGIIGSGTFDVIDVEEGVTYPDHDFVVDPVVGFVTGVVTSPDPNSGLGAAACPGTDAPTQSCEGFQFASADPSDGSYGLALAPGTWSVAGFGAFPIGIVGSATFDVIEVEDGVTYPDHNFQVEEPPHALVVGYATAAGGSPAAGSVIVGACPWPEVVAIGCSSLHLGYAAPDGSYSLGLPPGNWNVRAARFETNPPPDFDEQTPPVTLLNLVADQTVTCNFEFGGASPDCDAASDSDGDGVLDAIDSGDGAFTDVIDGQPDTTGSIVSVDAGVSILIDDEPDPAGVRITVTGAGEAVLDVCGGSELHLIAGTYVVTCGSVTIQVVSGSATLVFSDDTSLSIPSGAAATVTKNPNGSFEISGVSGGTVTLTIEGTSIEVGPGDPPKTFTTWDFSGFQRPVDNLPVLNIVKAGQAVPLKWQLLDTAGAPVTTLANATIRVASIECSSGTTADLLEEVAAGGSGLQNLGDGYYQVNWKTPKSYAGSCKRLKLDLGEGVTRDALMRFKA